MILNLSPTWSLFPHHMHTPLLVIKWPAPGGFTDEASYAFRVLRETGSIAQRVVEREFGADVLREVLASTADHPEEKEPSFAERVWEKIEHQGFIPGDYDQVERLRIDARGMHLWRGDHQYGRYTGAEEVVVDVPDAFEPLRGRIDAYLALRASLSG